MILRGESTIIDYHAPFDQGFNVNTRVEFVHTRFQAFSDLVAL